MARFRAHARAVGISEVSLQGRTVRFSPATLRESQELRLRRIHPGSIYKNAVATISVPRPSRGSDGTLTSPPRPGQEPVRDVALLDWCRSVLDSVLDTPTPAGADAT